MPKMTIRGEEKISKKNKLEHLLDLVSRGVLEISSNETEVIRTRNSLIEKGYHIEAELRQDDVYHIHFSKYGGEDNA